MSILDSANLFVARKSRSQYQIERSLRFNSADSAYLNLTTSKTPTNASISTTSFWVKRSVISGSSNYCIFGCSPASTLYGEITFSNDRLQIQNIHSSGGTSQHQLISNDVFRDVSAWYHIVVMYDTTQATANNRTKVYVNNRQITSWSTETYLGQNVEPFINSGGYARGIGKLHANYNYYFDGYLAEFHHVDGQALTPSSFGETDTITGVWKPKRYSGTYGTNGFYLKFADNSGTTSTTLGKDSSGNGNNWTPNNFSVTAGAGNDSMIDTPTPYADGGNGRGNYCTLNGAVETTSNGKATLSNGNLECSVPRLCAINGSFGITSGKWYWEVQPNDLANSPYGMGVFAIGKGITHGDTQYILVDSTGYRYTPGDAANQSSWGPTYNGSTDIIGLALDADARTLGFNKNGGSFTTFDYSSYSSMSGGVTPAWKSGGNLGTSGAIFNFGQRSFSYTPPSGFLALNTQNLPEPSIKKPSSYMDTLLYTGNGSARSITGLGFSPDLVWIKERSGADNHRLVDAVRGATKELYSSLTNAEGTDANGLTAFNSDGFSLGTSNSYNENGVTHVAWCWDESATPGFDIVTYTGTGSATTVAHNLGVAPSMIIAKGRTNVDNWPVGHTSRGWDRHILLNSTAAEAVTNSTWNNTAPTSSVFTVGTDTRINQNGITYVAYLWSEVAGFSKFGSYTGNGSSDGPFVHCGFRPRWVMIKGSSFVSNWNLLDAGRNSYNVSDLLLRPNLADAEFNSISLASGFAADFLSNGFKLRVSLTDSNSNGQTFVFAAFSESPFKYSLAR